MTKSFAINIKQSVVTCIFDFVTCNSSALKMLLHNSASPFILVLGMSAVLDFNFNFNFNAVQR